MKVEKPPTALKRWMEQVRDSGSIIDHRTPCQIHHIAGRTAKQDGYQVGHLLILPLSVQQHQWIDEGSLGLEELKTHYELANLALFDPEIEPMSLHEFEMFLWSQVVNRVPLSGWDVELTAARNWTRS